MEEINSRPPKEIPVSDCLRRLPSTRVGPPEHIHDIHEGLLSSIEAIRFPLEESLV